MVKINAIDISSISYDFRARIMEISLKEKKMIGQFWTDCHKQQCDYDIYVKAVNKFVRYNVIPKSKDGEC